jgi:hypothetical protein
VYGLEAHAGQAVLGGPPRQVGLPWAVTREAVHRADEPGAEATDPERVSEREGVTDFERLRAVAESISEHGFVPELGGYIRVGILLDDDEWVARLYAGFHRLAVVAALGIDPVRVAVNDRPGFVRRADVAYWPGVVTGRYSSSQALELFDRLVQGRAPDWYTTT